MKLEIKMIVSSAKEAADYYTKVLGTEILSQADTRCPPRLTKGGAVSARQPHEAPQHRLPAIVQRAPSFGRSMMRAFGKGCSARGPLQVAVSIVCCRTVTGSSLALAPADLRGRD